MRVLDTTTQKYSLVTPDTSGTRETKQLPVDYTIGSFPTWRCPRAEHCAVLVDQTIIYVIGGWTSAK